MDDGSCTKVSEEVCLNAGGLFQGVNTLCNQVECIAIGEACCFPNGQCAVLTPPMCTAMGGQSQGGGTTCLTRQLGSCP